MSSTVRGAIFGLTAAAIWGGMYVVSDIVLGTIPPFTLLTIRLVLGLFTLGLLLSRMRTEFPPRSELRRYLAVGVVGFGISLGFQFVGTEKSTAVNGALVTSASPAFILVFAALLLREKLTAARVLSVILATIGVIIIVDPTRADFSSDTFAGDIALTCAAVTWGLYSVLVRKVSGKIDTLVVTFLAFSGGMLLTLPAAVVELSQKSIDVIDAGIILGILYLGIVSTAGAMWMWNRAFTLVDASVASLFFFAQPLVGALLGVILLGQPFTAALAVGSAFIATGVILSVFAPEAVQAKSAPVGAKEAV